MIDHKSDTIRKHTLLKRSSSERNFVIHPQTSDVYKLYHHAEINVVFI